MLSFVICDDNNNYNRLMAKRLIDTIYEQQIIAHVALVTTSIDEVLAYSRKPISPENRNAYLLDIDFNSQAQGLTLAQTIRQYDRQSYIVFITAYPEFIMQSVKLKIFDYLLKPVSMEAVEKLVIDLYRDHVQTRSTCKQLIINSGGNVYFLRSSEIIYVESYRNKIVVHCHDKTIETYGALASIENRLAGEGFYRCHRSYLINLRQVRRLDLSQSLAIMSNGHSCHVSRRKQKGLIAYVDNAS